MRAIIDPHAWPTWLGRWESILRRCCDRLAMIYEVWPVSKQVNSPRNNGAELLEAIG